MPVDARIPDGLTSRPGYSIVPSHIDGKDFPTKTDAGRRWLIKALHPAESTIKAERAPGVSRYPTAVQEVTSTFIVRPPPGIQPGDTWSFRLVTHTDPLCPVSVYGNIDGQAEVYLGEYLNQAFFKAGDAYDIHTWQQFQSTLAAFNSACETYRINALSTTGVFVGASMTDMGSIVSSQFVDSTRSMAFLDSTAQADEYTALCQFWQDPLPAMSEATLGQRPYVSDAREGWYAPQKFEAPGHWQKTNDMAFRGRVKINSAYGAPPTVLPTDVIPWPDGGAASTPRYWLRLFDDSCSQTFVKSVAPTSTYRVTVRLVIEMGVTPSNDFAAFASDPAPPDSLAYEIYVETVNHLLDAYPAAYNDLGKLWDRIKGVVKKVAGVLDPVAGIAAAAGLPYAGAVKMIASGISGGVKKFVDSGEAKVAIEAIQHEKERLRKAGEKPGVMVLDAPTLSKLTLQQKIRKAKKQAGANARAAKAKAGGKA